MPYYRITCDTPYPGTKETYYAKLNESEIDDYAYDVTQDHGSFYEYLINGLSNEDPTEEELENFYQDCSYEYEEISKEEYKEESRNE